MVERSSDVVVPRREHDSPCMPNTTKKFSLPELRHLLRSARLAHRQSELDIRYSKRDSESSRLPGRILIITPRRVGTAPQRNLIRRRLKAIFFEEKLFEHSFDIVIFCRKGASDLSFEDLKKLLLQVFSTLATSTIKK